jgi:general secretion pathway protein J
MKPPRPHRPVRHSPGFTLLELLIALAVSAIVLAAVNGVFYGALRLRNKTAQSFEEKLPAQQAVEIIERDLKNLVPPGGLLSGSFKSSLVTSELDPQNAMQFYTTTGVVDDTSPFGDVQKVAYVLSVPNANETGRNLLRAVTRNLLPVIDNELPAQQWLLSGVEEIVFTFYDGSQWRDTWDSTTPDLTTGLTNTLPKAIKLQVQFANEIGQPAKAPLEIVAPIVVTAATNTPTTASTSQR